MAVTKSAALAALRPAEEWEWVGRDYSGLTWMDDTVKPSEADITTKYDSMVAAAPMIELRRQRDVKLHDCDWTQASDSPLSGGKKTEWATHRQALRDLPASASPTLDSNDVLGNVTWPTEP
jgi:hypothetical protein